MPCCLRHCCSGQVLYRIIITTFSVNNLNKHIPYPKKIVLHSLRHSLATHLLEASVSLKCVQFILGHKHLTTTLIYAHMTDTGLENLRKEMDKMASDL